MQGTTQLRQFPPMLEQFAVGATVLVPLSMFIGSAASDILLSLIAACFMFHCALVRDFSSFKQPWVQAGLLLWGYLLARSAFAAEPIVAYGRAVPWVRFLLFALATQALTLNTPERRQRLLWGVGAAVVFAILDTIMQYHTGFDIFHHPSWDGSRLTGPLRWPTDGITLHWLGLPLIAFGVCRMWQASVDLKQRLAIGAGILLLVGTIVMTGDRAAFLLTLLAMGGVLICYPRTWKVLFSLGGAGGIVVAGLLWLQPAQLTRQLSTLHDVQHFAHSPYGNVWRGGIAVFKSAPVFGVGLKHYRVECVKYQTTNPNTGELETCNIHPHNLYLEWLSESGIIGLLLLLTLCGCAMRHLWLTKAKWLQEAPAAGAVLIVLTRLLPIVPSASFFVAWAAIPFWLMLGWALASSSQASNK